MTAPPLPPEIAEQLVEAALSRLGPAIWPVSLSDGGGSRRLRTAVRWMHAIDDDHEFALLVLPREGTADVTLGAIRHRPELTTPPGACDADQTALQPFLEHWTIRNGAELLLMPMADMDQHADSKGFAWAEAGVHPPRPSSDEEEAEGEAIVVVIGHSGPESAPVTTGAVGLLQADTGDIGVAHDIPGLLGGVVLRLITVEDQLALRLHGLVIRASGATLRSATWREVEDDLRETLAPYL